MTLDSFFDKIFIITCKSFKERHVYFEKHFKENNITNYWINYSLEKENFDDLKISSSEKSLIHSHISCITKSIECGFENILICEDDVNFVNDLDSKFNTFISNLPCDWDFLQLGNQFWVESRNSHWLVTKKINEHVNRFFWGTGSHCIGINKKNFDLCINKFKNMNSAIDYLYYDLYKTSICYSPTSFIADAISKQTQHGCFDEKYIFDSKIRHSC